MDERILLPSSKDVLRFVNIAEQVHEKITVSKEDCPYSVSGSSILGMMTVIGSRVIVHAKNRSSSLADFLCRYRVE